MSRRLVRSLNRVDRSAHYEDFCYLSFEQNRKCECIRKKKKKYINLWNYYRIFIFLKID